MQPRLHNHSVADVVYLTGAGLNCSLVDPASRFPAPLARNFFQVLLASGWFRDKGGLARKYLPVDSLEDEIRRYWRLKLSDLESTPFDIEECLTLFESLLEDSPPTGRATSLAGASLALRNLLLWYLEDFVSASLGTTPAARRLGRDVLAESADVITFNYDTVVEHSIEMAAGAGAKTGPTYWRSSQEHGEYPDEDLDASHFAWNRALAYGFEFDELTIPISGVAPRVGSERYYRHPSNALYATGRVLKLHGSLSWRRYTDRRVNENGWTKVAPPVGGNNLTLSRSTVDYTFGGLPVTDGYLMEPVVIPPQLYKRFDLAPFHSIWREALKSLAGCRRLVVVGYSFPPTDFRTRRLFLEAFRESPPEEVVVVNPDTSVLALVRQLTGFKGPVLASPSLSSLYGVPASDGEYVASWKSASTAG